MIPFNKPYITGKEVHYIYDAVASGHISGNGKYTKLCQQYFENQLGCKKALLTTSCTDALEMCALLLDIQPGDEVIIPSYTFVSTALAFVRQGAKIVFADSRMDHPGIDEDKIEELITSRTKAIVPVHYAGVACDMDKIMDIANRHSLFVVEDAAQAVDSYFTGRDGKKKPLGSIGHLATFSFHETKNIQCGEGGLLAINDNRFVNRAEIIWEKGTNRAEFFRGAVNKYGWVDIGSSFLPSEVVAAFLWAQIEQLEYIQKRRKEIWELYYNTLKPFADKGSFRIPELPQYATNNAHMFYLVFNTLEERSRIINHLKEESITSVFHYLSLHSSPYYHVKHDGKNLPLSDKYSETLVRLPFYYNLSSEEQNLVINRITMA
jgi:dTDP-4-amino-4,6-dideoxygalactose transaminase